MKYLCPKCHRVIFSLDQLTHCFKCGTKLEDGKVA